MYSSVLASLTANSAVAIIVVQNQAITDEYAIKYEYDANTFDKSAKCSLEN